MATDIVQSLFGVTPEAYQQQQQALLDRQALQFAQLDPMAQATYGIYRGAGQLGGALGRALGGEDPELARISLRQQIASQLDFNDPTSIQRAREALRQSNDAAGLLQLDAVIRQAQESGALVRRNLAAEKASLAQAGKVEMDAAQETKLRNELTALGPTATQEQITAVMSRYGSPDRVLATLQASADKEAARIARDEETRRRAEEVAERARLDREGKIEAARVAADAKVEAARQRGADARELERIRVEGKKDVAELVASLKGPSAAVLKAQEKAEKIAEGQAALGDTLSTAKTLIADLAKMGGITSTSKGALANLITSAQTGTVGQMAGRAVGTAAQAKRDELKSIRLQLLNSVKEATGMSAQQLNSNVELQTYLNSLGSEGMSKEANEAILDNLSKRYLRKMRGAGTREDPIKLD
jgi:hypothetical protein